VVWLVRFKGRIFLDVWVRLLIAVSGLAAGKSPMQLLRHFIDCPFSRSLEPVQEQPATLPAVVILYFGVCLNFKTNEIGLKTCGNLADILV